MVYLFFFFNVFVNVVLKRKNQRFLYNTRISNITLNILNCIQEKILSLFTNRLPTIGYQRSVTNAQLQATSDHLSVIKFWLPVISNQLLVTGYQ